MSVTGLTPESLKHLQLDAGIFFKNLDYAEATDAASLAAIIAAAIESREGMLGATRGGGTFAATPTTREVEADGMRAQFVGSTRIDMWDVKLTTTLIEATPDNFVIGLGSGRKTVEGNITKVNAYNEIQDDNYIEKVQWISEVSDGSYVMIEIDNAISTTGLNFTFTDKNEGTIPIELTGRQANMLNQDRAPFTILHFGKASA